MGKCAICKIREADKTNSHIIPSFLIAMVASSDNSYRRDKEILYTMTPHVVNYYIGRNTSIQDIERNFSKLNEDELEATKTHNAAMDYIFCSQCEESLGCNLESPYASTFKDNKKISAKESLFFWLSVIWRMSEFNFTYHGLSQSLSSKLRQNLSEFLYKNENSKNQSIPFCYKVLYCKDYCRNNAGMIYLHYDKRNRIASAFFGDFVICILFQGNRIPKKYKFYGLETLLRLAPLNDCSLTEQRLNISSEKLKIAYSMFVEMARPHIINHDVRQIHRIWKRLKDIGIAIPVTPNKMFINKCIYLLHDETIPIGDRCSPKFFIQCFVKSYQLVYGVRLTN